MSIPDLDISIDSQRGHLLVLVQVLHIPNLAVLQTPPDRTLVADVDQLMLAIDAMGKLRAFQLAMVRAANKTVLLYGHSVVCQEDIPLAPNPSKAFFVVRGYWTLDFSGELILRS
jgi:hypothetical protein